MLEINLEKKINLGAKTVKCQQEEEHSVRSIKLLDLPTGILLHGEKNTYAFGGPNDENEIQLCAFIYEQSESLQFQNSVSVGTQGERKYQCELLGLRKIRKLLNQYI